jgi:N-acetylglucosamine-6-phosphate deacetylase
MVVTDATAPAGLGPGRYTLGRWDIVVDSDMVPRSPDRSHFVGSAVTMPQSADNLHRALDLPAAVLRQLTSENPGRLIGV